MPKSSRSSAQIFKLNEARSQRLSGVLTPDASAAVIEKGGKTLEEARQKIQMLEGALHAEKLYSALLQKKLKAEEEKTAELSEKVEAIIEEVKELQQIVKVERRARQRGKMRKTVLELAM